MGQSKAMIRELVERLEGVARTHFELEIKGHSRKKTLVVEVDFDLDANSAHYSRAKIDSIENTFATVIREENGDVISKLKIVGRAHQAANKIADASTGHGASSTKNAKTDLRSSPN
ncbi:hypothetical protein QWJ07_01420 [Frankia sp. RB7]|nr:hypothetical protein [Frankia sp. RB7]